MFSKKDLENGMIVEVNNGAKYFVCDDRIYGLKGFLYLKSYDEDLVFIGDYSEDFTIRKVYKTNSYGTGLGYILDKDNDLDIAPIYRGQYYKVFEREDVVEMTLEDVCMSLGKKIKIVPND